MGGAANGAVAIGNTNSAAGQGSVAIGNASTAIGSTLAESLVDRTSLIAGLVNYGSGATLIASAAVTIGDNTAVNSGVSAPHQGGGVAIGDSEPRRRLRRATRRSPSASAMA